MTAAAKSMRMNLKHQQAALALAEGRRIEEVAVECQVSVRTIQNWKERTEFQQLVTDTAAELQRKTLEEGIASRNYRLLQRNKRAQQIGQMVEELMNKQYRDKEQIKKLMTLLRFELDNEKQAAIEANQWNQKMTLDLSTLTDEQVLELLQKATTDDTVVVK